MCARTSLPSLLAVICFGLFTSTPLAAQSVYMYAHFINVGQADATLLEFPCGAILIDAGSQDAAYTDSLANYLERFFRRRTDLQRTLDVVYITHNHIDHTRALRTVVENFTVERYVDNGQLEGIGTANPKWVRGEAATRGIQLKTILNTDVFTGDNHSGLTDTDIDPITCANCDPNIRILSGQMTDEVGWSPSDFDNKNNHSLVIRVDFGESSFLFTGDLEKPAIETLLNEYAGHLELLDTDVYKVGHHGSSNGTTSALLRVVSPEMAVISCGTWNYGKNTDNNFTTWSYGHPRKVVINSLSSSIRKNRSKKIIVKAATAVRSFVDTEVSKRTYGTPWEGNIKVRAGLDGRFYVTTKW